MILRKSKQEQEHIVLIQRVPVCFRDLGSWGKREHTLHTGFISFKTMKEKQKVLGVRMRCSCTLLLEGGGGREQAHRSDSWKLFWIQCLRALVHGSHTY